MIRYKLNPNDQRIVVVDDDENPIKTIYTDTNDIFVDIIGNKKQFRKVRIFLKDEVFIGWITTHIENLIVIHNKEDLYDGRFNSDRLEEQSNGNKTR